MSLLRSLLMLFIGLILVDAVMAALKPDKLNNLVGLVWVFFMIVFIVLTVADLSAIIHSTIKNDI